MNYIELSGQPGSGKSTFLISKKINYSSNDLYKKIFKKIIFFWEGLKYLPLKRLRILLHWSYLENVSFFFKINIFLNSVSKFGSYQYLIKRNINNNIKFHIIDEGISHLPFLFLNTNPENVIDLISFELKRIKVIYLISPGFDIIKKRLLSRGHKRLRFLMLNKFLYRIQEIERVILSKYPILCKEFKILNNVENI